MSVGTGILRLPSEVRFGFGVRRAVPRSATALGDRVLVIADPFLSATPEFEETIREIEAMGAVVRVLTEIPAELPVAAVEAAAADAKAFAPDVVVGYGGGSALDASKLVSLLLAHGGQLSDYYGENAVPGPVVPLVAVPTTAGTGSEVTPVAVVSDPARALKVGISSPHLIPRLAIVDPELTLSAPRAVTVHSGIDAFVHAVESFTAAELEPDHGEVMPVFIGRNVLTSVLSLEAARVIFRALPAVVDDPSDRDARYDMSYGSLLAGMAFGATGTHLSHAVQYPIGALTHTPHGLGTGTLLPFALQACLPNAAIRISELGVALGVEITAGSVDRRAQSTVDAIGGLCASVGLPASLSEIGVRLDQADRIVSLTLEVRRLLAIAPVTADAALIQRIVVAAIAGDRDSLIGDGSTR